MAEPLQEEDRNRYTKIGERGNKPFISFLLAMLNPLARLLLLVRLAVFI